MEMMYDIRRMDKLGRFVIPAPIRSKMEWDTETALEITADEQGVFLRRRKEICALCGTESELEPFGSKFICKKCVGILRK